MTQEVPDGPPAGHLMHEVKVLKKRLDFADRSSALTYDRASEFIVRAFKGVRNDHPTWDVPVGLPDSVRKRLMGLLVTEVRNNNTPMEDLETFRTLLEAMAAAQIGNCYHSPSMPMSECQRCMARRLLKHMNAWNVEQEVSDEEEAMA